jgi:hypothetical protein
MLLITRKRVADGGGKSHQRPLLWPLVWLELPSVAREEQHNRRAIGEATAHKEFDVRGAESIQREDFEIGFDGTPRRFRCGASKIMKPILTFRQPEHPLANNIALDLTGSARDTHHSCAEHPIGPFSPLQGERRVLLELAIGP